MTHLEKKKRKKKEQLECFSLENQHLHLIRGNKYGEGGSVGMYRLPMCCLLILENSVMADSIT